MIDRRIWLWAEAVLCLPYAAILSIFGLAMTTHWIVVTAVWGGGIPSELLVHTVYAASTALGIAGVVILLCTRLGVTASVFSLNLTRIGLAAGILASLLIPGGYPDLDRSEEPVFALFASVTPCVCYAHFGYLARRTLLRL